ncbi:DNA-binding protein [Rugosibacter aromaticivorans]|uniref:DNA-binding protein n=1 Tax=Rugosibacter aromaticivorans TaxID=1565605 RepID=A0A0C5IXI5_9PROT|nr:helix-turn-helix domain-containing protein [Rugosibacter aromaticivorans]AJP47422.1 DNA-binding protein [Rugosibacter aromaticivorans]TBR16595.1 MAG: helix-turn-helix domain-containing protein [Rugosibacter sp.]
MDEKTEFAERLRDAMTTAGYQARPSVLEKEFNSRYWGRSVTFQAVSRWLRGEAIPSQEKLQVLADWLGVEPHVLRFGAGPIKAIREKAKRWDEGVGYLEREVFETFLSLPAPQRKIVREVILTFAKAQTASKPDKKKPRG